MDEKNNVYTVPPDMRKKSLYFGLRWYEGGVLALAVIVGIAILVNFGLGSAAVAAMLPAAVFILFHRADERLPEKNMFNTIVKVVKFNFTTQYFSLIQRGKLTTMAKERKKEAASSVKSNKRKTNT